MNPEFEALLAFAPGEKTAGDHTAAAPPAASPVARLREAKALSDRGDMAGKNRILADMVAADPQAFVVDSPAEKYPGLTHSPSGFQIHAHPGVAAQVAKPDTTLIDMLALNSSIQTDQDDRYKLAAAEKVAHFVVKCKTCDGVVRQCRCTGPKEVSYDVCRKCSGEKAAAFEDAPVTVCVDFDGTLAKIQKPFNAKTAGRPRRKIVRLVRLLKEKGCRIIVWTVRGNSRLLKRWLKENRVPYDFINENPDQPPGSSGKLYADVYLDDKAVNGQDADAAVRGVLDRVAPLLSERHTDGD